MPYCRSIATRWIVHTPASVEAAGGGGGGRGGGGQVTRGSSERIRPAAVLLTSERLLDRLHRVLHHMLRKFEAGPKCELEVSAHLVPLFQTICRRVTPRVGDGCPSSAGRPAPASCPVGGAHGTERPGRRARRLDLERGGVGTSYRSTAGPRRRRGNVCHEHDTAPLRARSSGQHRPARLGSGPRPFL